MCKSEVWIQQLYDSLHLLQHKLAIYHTMIHRIIRASMSNQIKQILIKTNYKIKRVHLLPNKKTQIRD